MTTRPHVLPELKDWKQAIQDDLGELGNSKEDILKIFARCGVYIDEIEGVSDWISGNMTFAKEIMREYYNLYRLRFGEEPPNIDSIRNTDKTNSINNTLDRRNVIREIAKNLGLPDSEITVQIVKDELKKRNLDLNAKNPGVVIATILNGYVEEFEKVPDKKGTFKRVSKTSNLS